MSDQDVQIEAPVVESTIAPVVEAPVIEAASDKPLNEGDAVAPAYQPSYKFKAMDKEHEFEDWAKPLITSKEVEEKMFLFNGIQKNIKKLGP